MSPTSTRAHTAPLLTFWPHEHGEPVPIVESEEETEPDVWIALGHLTVAEFRALYGPEAATRYTNPAVMRDDAIRQTWAVVVLADPDWTIDQAWIDTDATWATPGAVRVTVGVGDVGAPVGQGPRLRAVTVPQDGAL